MTPEHINILNNIKRHIDSSKAKDLCHFWSKKIEELEEYKSANDPKNLFKHAKNLMGKKNYTMGMPLKQNNIIYNGAQEQANLLADTWRSIMTPNTPKNLQEIQEHFQRINNWYQHNTDNINSHPTVNLNNLDKKHILMKPITLQETATFLNKIKSKATGPHKISHKILKHTPLITGISLTYPCSQ